MQGVGQEMGIWSGNHTSRLFGKDVDHLPCRLRANAETAPLFWGRKRVVSGEGSSIGKSLPKDSAKPRQRQTAERAAWLHPHLLECDPVGLQLQDPAQQDVVVSQLHPPRVWLQGSEVDAHRVRGSPRWEVEMDATGQDHFAAFRSHSKASRRNTRMYDTVQ